ncbi:MAG: Flp pilus assembly protein CpaB [Caulobacteraceae bacterium]|nr:Flp pilus assembly protein CpaB [Caulobacteraceae bacterium]
MNLRVLVLAVAAVAAVALALVLGKVLKPKPAPAPVQAAASTPAPAKPMTRVLVAKHDLNVGAGLTETDVSWQAWPSESLNPAFITGGPVAAGVTLDQVAKAASDLVDKNSLKELTGATVRNPILTGEPIMARKLVRAGDSGYLAVVLTPGMLGIAVPVNAESGAGGFVLPGDRVDVLQSRESPNPDGAQGGAKSFAAQTILQNVKVLAIDQAVETPKDSKSMVGAVATLEVSPIAAKALMKAKAEGTLALALRSYADAGAASGVTTSVGAQRIVTVYKGGEVTSFAVTP